MAVNARPDHQLLDQPDHPVAGTGFDELWELRGDLRGLCHRLVGDVGDAEDVVQDTLLLALANAERLHRQTSYAGWLATVARRRSIDGIRVRNRVQLFAVPPEPAPTSSADPLDHVLRQEAVGRVRAALAELAPRERRLLLRQVSHGLSIADLAEAEATTAASVRSVLARARSKLRTAVERDGPLGAAALPPLGLAAKRRVHRWSSALDGRAPVLAGAVAQIGDMVVAAAAALLLAASTPSVGPEGPPVPPALPTSEAAASPLGEPSAAREPARHDPAEAAGDADRAPAALPPAPPWPPSPPTTVLPSPSRYVDVPWLSDRDGGIPESAVIDSFAASADGQVVLAGGSTHTGSRPSVYRSADAGQSWQRLDAKGFLGGRLLVAPSYPADPTILAALPSGPLWRSDDDGRFFAPAAPGRGVATLVPGYGPGYRRVLLATPHLLAYDVESGTTSAVGLGPTVSELGGLATAPSFPVDGLVLVGGAVRVRTHTAGAVYRCRSFDPCTSVPLPGSTGAPGVHVSSSPGVVVAYTRQALHRSGDGGNTFTAVALPAGMTVKAVTDGAPGELLLAGLLPDGWRSGGLLRSTDGGATWTPLGAGTALDGGSMQVVRLANGRILAALHPTRGGLLCSADNGATWAPRCPPTS